MLASESHGPEDAPVLLFLHGLLGSRRNWRAVAKDLSQDYRCILADLPNHGDSPHQEDASAPAMARALLEWTKAHLAPNATFTLCGHSLGGKLAMKFAVLHPERLQKLIIADIAPRDYSPNHNLGILDALLALDIPKLRSRKEADAALAPAFPNFAFRQFLLTNLAEEKKGKGTEKSFHWKPNLHALRRQLPQLSANPLAPEDVHSGPTLVLAGGKSDYVRPQDHALIRRHLPRARIQTLPQAGHFLQAEDKPGFLLALRRFLLDEEQPPTPARGVSRRNPT